MDVNVETVFAIIVGVLSIARLTRLLTLDTYPPVVWLRTWWDVKTDYDPDSPNEMSWGELFHCPWCMAPWVTIPVAAWGYYSDLNWAWWAFNGWLAAAYAAAWITTRD